MARLGDPQGVDEVLQEVALAAVKQQAPLQDANKVAPWLYRLAVTQCLLYRRKLGRRRKLNNNYADAVLPTEHDTSTPDPPSWLLADERTCTVRVALTKLQRRDRELLLLKYTEDWSYHQIAAHLGRLMRRSKRDRICVRGKLRQVLTQLQVVEAG